MASKKDRSPYQGIVQKKPASTPALQSQSISSIRIGPIPSPQDMALYNQHIPNGADRIMRMAETQSTHRIGIENKVISAQQKQGSRGQLLGFAIGVVGILAGSYVALHGHDNVGGGVSLEPPLSVWSMPLFPVNAPKNRICPAKQNKNHNQIPFPFF